MSESGGTRPLGTEPSVLASLTKAINSNLDLKAVLQAVTDAGTELSGAAFGAFFYNGHDEHGELYHLHVLSGVGADEFAAMPLPRITPLFEPTFAGASTVLFTDLDLRRPPTALPHGHPPVRSYLATPVVARTGEVIGALLFGHPESDVFDANSEQLVRMVAEHAAVAVQNARMFEAEQSARQNAELAVDRLALLQQVTARLATALTTTEVLTAVLESLGDAVGAARLGVYLRDGDDFRVVTAPPSSVPGGHGDQMTAPPSPALRVLPVSANTPMRDAAQTRRPVVLRAGDLERNYPEVAAASQSAVGSAVVLPLLLPDSVSGVLAIAWADARALPDGEVDVLAAAAGQVASALERARLYEALTEVSRTLQRSLLPRQLPRVERVSAAVRYVAGTAGVEVGGDWYDVAPTPDGGATFVIGDVQGHSVHAASVMGQLRAALHAYLAEGHAPDTALRRVNRVLADLDPHVLATCTLAALAPETGELVLVRAGHPNPLLRRADGAVTELDVEGGVPLGVLDDPYWPTTRVRLRAGDRLVLYTDGLVERAGQDLDVGITCLRASVEATGHQDVDAAADAILATVGDRLTDDVALLVCDFAGPSAGHRTAYLQIEPHPRAVGQARRFTRETIAGWQLVVDTVAAELVVSELVTNALRHARGQATLELRSEPDRLRIGVTDGGTHLPRVKGLTEPLDTGGRGLQLVQTLSLSWGVAPHGQGKTTWAELDASAAE